MKLLKWLDENFEDYILVFLMVVVVALTFSQVVMRYVFNSSLAWSEELARYMFIWIIYVGVSKAITTDSHLTVDALDSILTEKQQVITSIMADILFIVFSLIIVVFTTNIVMTSTRVSGALQIPLSYIYAASAVGFTLSIIRLIQRIIRRVKEYKAGEVQEVPDVGIQKGRE